MIPVAHAGQTFLDLAHATYAELSNRCAIIRRWGIKGTSCPNARAESLEQLLDTKKLWPHTASTTPLDSTQLWMKSLLYHVLSLVMIQNMEVRNTQTRMMQRTFFLGLPLLFLNVLFQLLEDRIWPQALLLQPWGCWECLIGVTCKWTAGRFIQVNPGFHHLDDFQRSTII